MNLQINIFPLSSVSMHDYPLEGKFNFVSLEKKSPNLKPAGGNF